MVLAVVMMIQTRVGVVSFFGLRMDTFRDRSLDYFNRRDRADPDRLGRLFPEFSTQSFISAVLPWVDHPMRSRAFSKLPVELGTLIRDNQFGRPVVFAPVMAERSPCCFRRRHSLQVVNRLQMCSPAVGVQQVPYSTKEHTSHYVHSNAPVVSQRSLARWPCVRSPVFAIQVGHLSLPRPHRGMCLVACARQCPCIAMPSRMAQIAMQAEQFASFRVRCSASEGKLGSKTPLISSSIG